VRAEKTPISFEFSKDVRVAMVCSLLYSIVGRSVSFVLLVDLLHSVNVDVQARLLTIIYFMLCRHRRITQ